MNPSYQQEAQAFSEEHEYEHWLEREGRMGAEVMIDLQDRGPLYLYVIERRNAAREAMSALVHCDPSDSVTIAQFQGVIHEWTNVCDYIHTMLERADTAAQQIKEQYSVDDEPHHDA